MTLQTHARQPPGPRPGPRLLWELATRPLERFERGFRQYGDVVRYPRLRRASILVASPQAVDHVLRVNASNYDKSTIGIRRLRSLTPSILFSDGDEWLRKRRLMNPAFRKEAVSSYWRTMANTIGESLDLWAMATQEPLDFVKHISEMTLRVACKAFFGADVGLNDRAMRAITDLLDETLLRSFRPYTPPLWVPTPANRRFNAANRVLRNLISEVLERRRRQDDLGHDLLSVCVLRLDSPDGLRSDESIEELKQFLLAAQETTANGIVWALYYLAAWPEARAKLLSELQTVVGDRPLQEADLVKLPWVRQVFEESLRLRSPTWIFPRRPIEDDELGGYHIPKGTSVYLSPYLTHRHPAHWEDPETFDPSRFDPDRAAARHRAAYFPFGAGARQCIGREFARMEATTFLAMFMRRYDYLVEDRDAIDVQPSVTLRPTAFRVRLTAREPVPRQASIIHEAMQFRG